MTVQTSDQSVPRSLTRRKVLALGAAGLVTAALAACGGETAATATGAAGTVNAAGGTVAAAATQVAGTVPGGTVAAAAAQVAGTVPGAASGLLGTAQAAISSQVPGASSTIQAAGGTIQAAATRASGSAPVAGATVAAAGSTAGAAGGTAAASGGDPASRNNKYAGKPPAMTIDKTKKYFATIVTNKGTMKAELYADTAPLSVNNFVFLANDHFYDGVIFHRIVKGFVIQGGDPTGLGTGGPGYKFNDEPTSFTRNYEKGTLAMANSGPNTNGSQFFICLDNLTASNKLPKMYNIFGKVTDGLNVVDAIAATPTTRGSDGANSSPTEKVFMQTVTISMQ